MCTSKGYGGESETLKSGGSFGKKRVMVERVKLSKVVVFWQKFVHRLGVFSKGLVGPRER